MTCGYILFTVSMLPLRGRFTSCPYDTEQFCGRVFHSIGPKVSKGKMEKNTLPST